MEISENGVMERGSNSASAADFLCIYLYIYYILKSSFSKML